MAPAKAANEAALAGGIPSLKHEEGSLRGPEIRLLDALKRILERRQTPLIVGKVQLGVTVISASRGRCVTAKF
jgi:hypothetical protein